MNCEACREVLSAHLDNEASPDDITQPVDDHFESCPECAHWYDHAALITRRTRTAAAVTWPDVSDEVLDRAPLRGGRRLSGLRLALCVSGALQGVVALGSLLFASGAGPGGATEIGYETAAWQFSLGATFVIAALRGSRTSALIPLLGAFVAVMSLGYLTGLLAGRSGFGSVLAYLLAIAGLVLLVLLDRGHRPWPDPNPGAGAGVVNRRPAPPEDADEADQVSTRRRRRSA